MTRVYINKRPLKTAFLINPNDSDWQEKVDAVWEHNQHKWGGRYNPIVSTDGETLDDIWWTFLAEFDPDYLYTFSTLNPSLIEQLNKKLRPIEIEFARQPNSGEKVNVNSRHEGVYVFPSDSNLKRFQKIISNDVLAAIRGLTWTVDADIYRFLLQNFGMFEGTYPFDRRLERVEKQISLSAGDRDELLALFETLMTTGIDLVYPVQFSMLGRQPVYLELENEHAYDVFGIVVGDSFNDQVFYRNKGFYERDLSHRRINHIRLPTFFAEDDELMEALGGWLRRTSSEVHLFSFSLEATELESVGERLDVNTSGRPLMNALYKSFTSYAQFPLPKYGKKDEYSFFQRFARGISIPKGCDVHTLIGARNGKIEVEAPSQTEGVSENGSWIAELYIEASKERFYQPRRFYKDGEPFLWRLPRKNYLARDMFKRDSRIDARGITVTYMSGKKVSLTLQLPDDVELIRSCFVGDWKGRMQCIVPRRPLEIDYAQPSNIGKYLAGFIEVFGGLDLAHAYLEDRFWRNVFAVMANREPAKEATLLSTVKGKLMKKIREGQTLSEIRANFESLAEFVIQLAKDVALDGKETDYQTLLRKKTREHDELMNQINETWPFSEKALEKQISELLELGVLLMGVSQKCPRCGSNCWFSIGDLSQDLFCQGCRQAFSLKSNPTILYKLSTLARHGVFTHGLVPVTLSLGQILKDARSSFFFGPCMDLFKATPSSDDGGEKYDKITDADIACIQDGRFILGEIKQSQSQFTRSQMTALAEVAEIVEADVLLFSSLEDGATSRTNNLIEEVKKQLKHTSIEVGWYPLDREAFLPSRGDC